MGNENNGHKRLNPNGDKQLSKDDSSIVNQKNTNKINLDDDNNDDSHNNNIINTSNIHTNYQNHDANFQNYYYRSYTQGNNNNFTTQFQSFQTFQPQMNTNQINQSTIIHHNEINANQQQFNMIPNHDFFKQVHQPQVIPQNDNVTKDDLHLIKEFIKKCDEKYQEGCIEVTSNNNYTKALQIFLKIKTSLLQLLDIIKSKHYLPLDFIQNVTDKLNARLEFTSEAVDQCNVELLKQQHNTSNTKINIASQIDTNTFNFQQNTNNKKDLYKSQFVQPHNPNVDKRNNSNPPKKGKETSQTIDAFEAKIESEILVKSPNVKFSDIVGMNNLKQIIYEIVVMPTVRPDLFTGLRKPQRGLLLFGPPGTGKTMIAKAIAGECSCTFFNISASSLTSKWIGEGEKTVRGLFQLAYKRSPSIIFIDEIESVLSKRSDNDNDAAKRLKTEFLIQFDGLSTNADVKLLVIGATNRPMDLDDALLRRLPKRVYCGPLDFEGRREFIKTIMKSIDNKLTMNDISDIAARTANYSNSDLKELCREASYQPLRELSNDQINKINKLRPIVLNDFIKAISSIRGTITIEITKELDKWNSQFGVLN